MSEAIAAKLDEARALIEKGWLQGGLRAGDQYCSLGAINAVEVKSRCWDLDLSGHAYDLIADAVGDSRDGFSLVDWNDAPERTQAEVIEAFRKAAELARGEQSAMGRAG